MSRTPTLPGSSCKVGKSNYCFFTFESFPIERGTVLRSLPVPVTVRSGYETTDPEIKHWTTDSDSVEDPKGEDSSPDNRGRLFSVTLESLRDHVLRPGGRKYGRNPHRSDLYIEWTNLEMSPSVFRCPVVPNDK